MIGEIDILGNYEYEGRGWLVYRTLSETEQLI